MFDLAERNRKIKENGAATRRKRQAQTCKTFKFKVDKSHLCKEQNEYLKMSLVEAKWIYNHILAQDNPTNINYKTLSSVTHKDKDKNDVISEIKYLGASVRQELIQQIKSQIKSLAELKRKGHNIGKLRFKSEFKSIKYKQYGNTHSVRGNRIKLQGCKKPIYVKGLKQLSKYDNIDFTTANLIYDGYDYFITLTYYIDKKQQSTNNDKNNICGIDLGLADNITLSDGSKFNAYVEETERMKKLQRSLARKQKRSNNWYKTKSLINKEYAHIVNKKNDIANKLVAKLCSDYDIIVTQDDNLNEWKYNKNSNKKVQHSILGRVKSCLKHKHNVVFLDKYFPTTKYCPKCGTKKCPVVK